MSVSVHFHTETQEEAFLWCVEDYLFFYFCFIYQFSFYYILVSW